MYRKILFIIVMVGLVSLKTIKLNANDLQIVPPQKPSLSSEEIIKKISKNIISPPKKPSKFKQKEKKITIEEIKEKKLSIKIHKKRLDFLLLADVSIE